MLEEAAKLAGDVLAPLNKPGDEQGAALTKDGVVAADGFARGVPPVCRERLERARAATPNMAGKGCPG